MEITKEQIKTCNGNTYHEDEMSKALEFTVYDVRLLMTKEVTDRPCVVWAKIAQMNDQSLFDLEKLEESRAFRDFDERLYYFLDESEEIYDGLELDDGVYVVDHDYECVATFMLDEHGYVVSNTKKYGELNEIN